MKYIYSFMRSYAVHFFVVFLIFASYFYLSPLGDRTIYLNTKNYILDTEGMNIKGRLPFFKDEKKGIFFVHPGTTKIAKGTFLFKKNGIYTFDFSIRKGSSVGDIKFIIKKNGLEIYNTIVTSAHKSKKSLFLYAGEEIEILADKHGTNAGDWGNLQIQFQDSFFVFKMLIVPFIWIVLFFYLWHKRYGYIIMHAYIVFLLMLLAEKLHFGILSFSSIVIYMVLVFCLLLFSLLLYQELKWFKKFKISFILNYFLSFLVYGIPLMAIIYYLANHAKITKNILYAVFQSNGSEAYGYLLTYIPFKYSVLFVCMLLVSAIVLYYQEKQKIIKINRTLLLFIIATFSLLVWVEYAQLRLPNLLFRSLEKYNQEICRFKAMQQQRKVGKITFNAKKKERGETYIVIIGESLNRKHMGLYGYVRNTTPKLSAMAQKGNLTVFQNAYSNHTHTVPTLSMALTEANQYNHKRYYDSLSVIDIFKKANIETFWLTNQSLYSAWDSAISVIGTSSDHVISMNRHIGEQTDTEHFDGVLIREVDKVLTKKTEKNRVIFVHLMGNHWIYKSRYPHDKFEKYKGTLSVGKFGTFAVKNRFINSYDNSVLYNDYVVGSIIDKAKEDGHVYGVLYMSDHADDVVHQLGHESSHFTYEMTQIPMLLWFSKGYKDRYPERHHNLEKHVEKLFSNDMFYDSLMGICNIHSDKYSAKYDLSSDEYQLKTEDALTLHGEKYYTDKSNYIYWQKENIQYLLDLNQSKRVFPYRVNSLGKLNEIWYEGFRSFELDINLTKTGALGIENDKGMNLEHFITSVNNTDIEKIYLNIKNLTIKNYKSLLNRLDYLDKKYHIKKRCIVCMPLEDSIYSIREKGWSTSYTISTKNIVEFLKHNNAKSMLELANTMGARIKKEKISTIVFSENIYPFVKSYLAPLLNDEVAYHIICETSLVEKRFKEKLLHSKVYQDKRAKILLVPYLSMFDF